MLQQAVPGYASPRFGRMFRGAEGGLERHRKASIVVLSLAVVVLFLGAGVAYVHHLNNSAPPPLSFADSPLRQLATPAEAAPPRPADNSANVTNPAALPADGTAPAASSNPAQPAGKSGPASKPVTPTTVASPVEGRWVVGSGSVAGYRMGYSSPMGRGIRVGRTDDSSIPPGEIDIAGTAVRSGQFTVDIRKAACDGGSSCTDHVNQIMDAEHHPYETFVVSSPIELNRIPADGEQITSRATGNLTLRGVTRSVTFSVTARRNGGRIEVLGSVPVNREDYNIPDANEPGFSIDKNGSIEFLLLFDRRA